MKKIFLLGISLSLALSIFGVRFVLSLFQSVPVTIAQARPAQVVATGVPGGMVYLPFVMAAAPTLVSPEPTVRPMLEPIVDGQALNALPTLAPVAAEQAQAEEPPSTVVAGAAVAQAPAADQGLLEQFAASVAGRDAGTVSGVYVSGRFALPVLQQPVGDPSFVSTEENTVTQFGAPGVYGTIGLLAHNYLSGIKFYELVEGDQAVIVYGDGSQATYRITHIERYQALSPASAYSDFIDLADPAQAKISANQVFNRVYTGNDRLVFQTCMEAYGNPSWGRLFVIAEKINP